MCVPSLRVAPSPYQADRNHHPDRRVAYSCLIPQSVLYGISLLLTLSIAEKSRKKTDPYLVTFDGPDAVPLPHPGTFEKMGASPNSSEPFPPKEGHIDR